MFNSSKELRDFIFLRPKLFYYNKFENYFYVIDEATKWINWCSSNHFYWKLNAKELKMAQDWWKMRYRLFSKFDDAQYKLIQSILYISLQVIF